MKTFFKIAGALVGLLLITGLVIFFFFPQVLIDVTNSQNASAAGLEKKTMELDGYGVNYFISEDMSHDKTIVLVHGMGDDKNSFVPAGRKLSENYNLVAPDLSGHGENARTPGRDYSIAGQVAFLHAFIEKLDLGPVYLVGNSMGGHTSAAYALHHPDDVLGLVLVNAPGVKLDDHVVYTGFGEKMESTEDLDVVLKRVFANPPSLPGPVAKHMMKQVNESMDFVNNDLVTAITTGKDFNLKDQVHLIKAPTLILWGMQDEVVKYNVAEYYDANIPVSYVHQLEDAAHSPQLEVPDEVAKAIVDFIDKPVADMITSTKNDHAAKTQYYRWYQLYEGELSEARIANQLNILTDDVEITSAAGTVKGAANYPARLAAYEGWRNAHHVQNVMVKTLDDGTINLEADIEYQNIKPDGEESAYAIHYSTFLEEADGELLPKFRKLNLQPTGELPKRAFVPAYAENRMKSLLHYWLLNMEQLDGNVEPFREILAEGFQLNFSTSGAPMTRVEELEKWLNGTPMGLELSAHHPRNLVVKELGDNRYEVSVDLQWFGKTKDGKSLKAVTAHTWRVEDDPEERFARVKEVTVVQKEALSPL